MHNGTARQRPRLGGRPWLGYLAKRQTLPVPAKWQGVRFRGLPCHRLRLFTYIGCLSLLPFRSSIKYLSYTGPAHGPCISCQTEPGYAEKVEALVRTLQSSAVVYERARVEAIIDGWSAEKFMRAEMSDTLSHLEHTAYAVVESPLHPCTAHNASSPN